VRTASLLTVYNCTTSYNKQMHQQQTWVCKKRTYTGNFNATVYAANNQFL